MRDGDVLSQETLPGCVRVPLVQFRRPVERFATVLWPLPQINRSAIYVLIDPHSHSVSGVDFFDECVLPGMTAVLVEQRVQRFDLRVAGLGDVRTVRDSAVAAWIRFRNHLFNHRPNPGNKLGCNVAMRLRVERRTATHRDRNGRLKI